LQKNCKYTHTHTHTRTAILTAVGLARQARASANEAANDEPQLAVALVALKATPPDAGAGAAIARFAVPNDVIAVLPAPNENDNAAGPGVDVEDAVPKPMYVCMCVCGHLCVDPSTCLYHTRAHTHTISF